MIRVRSLTLALSLAAVLVTAQGCVVAAVAVGAAAAYGAVKYTDNEAYQDFTDDFRATWKASLAALRENGYPAGDVEPSGVVEDKVSINDATVHVLRITEDATRVTVRVGTFSTDEHKRRAAAILSSIAKQLD